MQVDVYNTNLTTIPGIVISCYPLLKVNQKYVTMYLMLHPCEGCGEQDIKTLEFHHLDPSTKSFSICSSLDKKTTREIEQEIRKCAVLCANCHNRITYENTYRTRCLDEISNAV